MATEREEILANFQEAVNRVMPQDTQTLPSDVSYSSAGLTPRASEVSSFGPQPSVNPISLNVFPPVSASNDIVVLPSTSHPRIRPLHFNIKYGDRILPLDLSDSETVGTIKTYLHSKLGIPPCSQELCGWKSAMVNDHTLLSSLNLCRDTDLILITPDPSWQMEGINSSSENVSQNDREGQHFTLKICDKTNKKQYSLNFPGSKTVVEIKQDVFALTDIPVRYQIWEGWPDHLRDDNVSLGNSGINFPSHNLSVYRAEVRPESKQGTSGKVIVDLTSDSSGEEFEDASESFGIEDEIFSQDIPVKKFQPLMPENAVDDMDAVSHFINKFTERYGESHVMFYLGTLDDALQEAFHKPAKERKLLAIYLHHDGSVLSNVFCTQLLCSETVVSYLTANFITWAWDLTFESNRARLLAMVTQHFGSLAATTVRNFNLDQLPLLLVIMRVRSATEVFTVIRGNVGLDELLTRLIHTVEVFSGQQQLEIVEEDEREAREQVKREQDAAYEASLMADRAKDEARRLEEEEKQRMAEQTRLEEERQEKARLKEQAEKTALRKCLEERLPVEPNENCLDPVSQIRIRLPTGEVISRRFLANTSLRVLLDFLTVQGYSHNEYKVLSSWPRKDLTALEGSLTLEQLKLYPQETITLEER